MVVRRSVRCVVLFCNLPLLLIKRPFLFGDYFFFAIRLGLSCTLFGLAAAFCGFVHVYGVPIRLSWPTAIAVRSTHTHTKNVMANMTIKIYLKEEKKGRAANMAHEKFMADNTDDA